MPRRARRWRPSRKTGGGNEKSPDPRGGRRVGMLAVGKSLKEQYDALAPPMPPHLAALVEQIKTPHRASFSASLKMHFVRTLQRGGLWDELPALSGSIHHLGNNRQGTYALITLSEAS